MKSQKSISSFFLLFIICLSSSLIHVQSQTPCLVLRTEIGLEVWSYDANSQSYVKKWESQPVFADENYKDIQKKKKQGLWYHLGATNVPLIKDIDGDGSNDLVVTDDLGIMIYGASPRYFPMDISGTNYHQICIEDIDNDGRNEFITQRSICSDEAKLGTKRILQIWKVENDRLKEIWHQTLPGPLSFCLQCEDVDNDGEREIITAYDTITILKKKTPSDWYISADLPNLGLATGTGATVVDVVRVADVDGDGKNEILATGNNGMLTIYKYLKQPITNRDTYPVLWQSPQLGSKDLQSSDKLKIPSVATQGLGVGDVDHDGQNEILVGTSEFLPGSKSGGKIHVFKYKGNREFYEQWISDWTTSAGIPAFAIGDFNGDQNTEFIYNGKEIYRYDPQDQAYHLIKKFPGQNYVSVAFGKIDKLQEPASGIRVVPIKWDLDYYFIVANKTFQTTLTLRNIWAEAKDVSFHLRSEQKFIEINDGTQKIGTMKTGEYADSKTISIKIGEPNRPPDYDDEKQKEWNTTIWLDIEAAQGYKQTIPISFILTLPKIQADIIIKLSLVQTPKIIEFLGRDPFEKETENLGDKIREYRRIHGLYQKKLAEQLGIDQTTVAW